MVPLLSRENVLLVQVGTAVSVEVTWYPIDNPSDDQSNNQSNSCSEKNQFPTDRPIYRLHPQKFFHNNFKLEKLSNETFSRQKKPEKTQKKTEKNRKNQKKPEKNQKKNQKKSRKIQKIFDQQEKSIGFFRVIQKNSPSDFNTLYRLKTYNVFRGPCSVLPRMPDMTEAGVWFLKGMTHRMLDYSSSKSNGFSMVESFSS